jgi:hypothetical protein
MTMLDTSAVYVASPVKPRRIRSTAQQVEDLWCGLYDIVKAMKPMTVRQVFYQATVAGMVDKTEAGYAKVQRALVQMRRAQAMPYSWLADNTRWQRKPRSFENVEVWLEKDALSGVVYPITSAFDVPLMVARGYASLSFLHTAAEHIATLLKPAFIYHLGDFDPSGVNAGEKIEQTLRELAPAAEIHFERLAVLPSQISDWNLPTRPTKASDTRAKNFGAISVELDAIHPNTLRGIVREAIELHMPPSQFEALKAAEQSERELLRSFVSNGDAQ